MIAPDRGDDLFFLVLMMFMPNLVILTVRTSTLNLCEAGIFPVFWEHDPYPWNWEF